MPNFIDLQNIDPLQLHSILDLAKKLKKLLKVSVKPPLLSGKQLAMIFEKPSTRTRVSFEVGINQLGGQAIFLNTNNSQLSRDESMAHTAKVLSRYVDLIMIRCYHHHTLLEMQENSTVPVINGLTDQSHPCQVLADIMTFEEHRGPIKNKVVSWIGDGNNMTNSWIQAAEIFDFNLRIATPKLFKPDISSCSSRIQWFLSPQEACSNSDLVNTDTWISMGDTNIEERHALLKEYQVNHDLMTYTKNKALFMHCLPAHIGEEVTKDVIEHSCSVVFDQAENRLHIQKAIMAWCLNQIDI